MSIFDPELPCDICGNTMSMEKFAHDGARFSCRCGQNWTFTSCGRAGCTILGRLYPAKMDEASPIYDEFLSYRLSHIEFTIHAKLLTGLMSASDAIEELATWQTAVEEKRREIAKTKETIRALPWWKRWFKLRA